MHSSNNGCVLAALHDCFGLHGKLVRKLGLPEHMSYVKFPERLEDMLHSDV